MRKKSLHACSICDILNSFKIINLIILKMKKSEELLGIILFVAMVSIAVLWFAGFDDKMSVIYGMFVTACFTVVLLIVNIVRSLRRRHHLMR